MFITSPASSITKTGRHDIAESGVKTPKINQIRQCSESDQTFSEFLTQKLIYSEFHDFVVIGNCKSNYHLITVTTIPFNEWSL
jgi:hypothetical protein